MTQCCIACGRDVHPDDIDLDGFCRFCTDTVETSPSIGKPPDDIEPED
jgi:hypothetical protein